MSSYDPSSLIRKQVLRIFYPSTPALPDQKVYVEFDADGEVMAMRDEIRILREALERIAAQWIGRGICHRYAPKPVIVSDDMAITYTVEWPWVGVKSVCGQWRKKKP